MYIYNIYANHTKYEIKTHRFLGYTVFHVFSTIFRRNNILYNREQVTSVTLWS